jgi:hypothetical protein
MATRVCTYIAERGGLNSIEGRYFLTYARSTLNDKVEGRTKRSKEWFTLCFLKSYELVSEHLFSADKVDKLCSVDLYGCVR